MGELNNYLTDMYEDKKYPDLPRMVIHASGDKYNFREKGSLEFQQRHWSDYEIPQPKEELKKNKYEKSFWGYAEIRWV